MFTLFLSFPAGNLLHANVLNDVNVNLVDAPMVKSHSVRFVGSRVHRKLFSKQIRDVYRLQPAFSWNKDCIMTYLHVSGFIRRFVPLVVWSLGHGSHYGLFAGKFESMGRNSNICVRLILMILLLRFIQQKIRRENDVWRLYRGMTYILYSLLI